MTPLPWIELHRKSSPDNEVDAVLVTRKDSGPPLYLIGDPTDLYLVPHGQEVPREPPYSPYHSKEDAIAKVRAMTPFHGYDVVDPRLAWQDKNNLLVGVKRGEIHQRKDSHDVDIGKAAVRRVIIRYFIEWDLMTEQKGPAFPKSRSRP